MDLIFHVDIFYMKRTSRQDGFIATVTFIYFKLLMTVIVKTESGIQAGKALVWVMCT